MMVRPCPRAAVRRLACENFARSPGKSIFGAAPSAAQPGDPFVSIVAMLTNRLIEALADPSPPSTPSIA